MPQHIACQHARCVSTPEGRRGAGPLIVDTWPGISNGGSCKLQSWRHDVSAEGGVSSEERAAAKGQKGHGRIARMKGMR